MSNNRLIYDNCAYKQQLQQSEGPADYMFYSGKYYNDRPCMVGFGVVGGNAVSQYTGNLVDLESDLRGITRDLSLCSANKYHPKCSQCRKCTNSGIPCDCLECQSQNLRNLPMCQLVDYSRTKKATPPNFQGAECHYRGQKTKGVLDGITQFFGGLFQ